MDISVQGDLRVKLLLLMVKSQIHYAINNYSNSKVVDFFFLFFSKNDRKLLMQVNLVELQIVVLDIKKIES